MNGKQAKRLRRELNAQIGFALSVISQRLQGEHSPADEVVARDQVINLLSRRKNIYRRMKRTYVRSSN